MGRGRGKEVTYTVNVDRLNTTRLEVLRERDETLVVVTLTHEL
jgi:hypothetical protein